MIQVGYEGQYGVAQMSDVVFSVAEKVPGTYVHLRGHSTVVC